MPPGTHAPARTRVPCRPEGRCQCLAARFRQGPKTVRSKGPPPSCPRREASRPDRAANAGVSQRGARTEAFHKRTRARRWLCIQSGFGLGHGPPVKTFHRMNRREPSRGARRAASSSASVKGDEISRKEPMFATKRFSTCQSPPRRCRPVNDAGDGQQLCRPRLRDERTAPFNAIQACEVKRTSDSERNQAIPQESNRDPSTRGSERVE